MPTPSKKHTPQARKIRIVGAREHNLKNVSLDLPRDELIVITGLSDQVKARLPLTRFMPEASGATLKACRLCPPVPRNDAKARCRPN